VIRGSYYTMTCENRGRVSRSLFQRRLKICQPRKINFQPTGIAPGMSRLYQALLKMMAVGFLRLHSVSSGISLAKAGT